MKTKLLLLILFVVFSASEFFSQTIQQKLLVVQNDGAVGQSFVVAVQVKGTSLTAANTLGSATIDVKFDNSKISYQSADTWAFGLGEGYSRFATNNTTSIQVGTTSSGVGPTPGGTGFDISTSYVTWVRLHFQILSTASTSLTIDNGTNQIGLFENHQNNPETGVINNQTLSTPENIVNQPLPVELNSFNAKAKGNDVELLWQTKTEVNNYGFEIERKSNDNESSNWVKIGFVSGSGNSNSPKDYTFVDKNLTGGTKFAYRLKQVDIDGTFTYSDKVELEVIPDKYELYQNYPNPFNPVNSIVFTIPEKQRYRSSAFRTYTSWAVFPRQYN